MQSKIDQLKTILHEVTDLQYVSMLLGWDQQTFMPPKGAAGRGSQLGTIRRLAHA